MAQPTHLDDIVRQDPTHLGFCDASGIGTGGVWLDPFRSSSSIVWHCPWTPDIIAALILVKNPGGALTNSDLKLSDLVLHVDTLLDVCPDANMATPRSGLDNTPTVSWSTREAYTINPVVADLLRIRTLHLRKFFSTLQSSTTQARRTA